MITSKVLWDTSVYDHTDPELQFFSCYSLYFLYFFLINKALYHRYLLFQLNRELHLKASQLFCHFENQDVKLKLDVVHAIEQANIIFVTFTNNFNGNVELGIFKELEGGRKLFVPDSDISGRWTKQDGSSFSERVLVMMTAALRQSTSTLGAVDPMTWCSSSSLSLMLARLLDRT